MINSQAVATGCMAWLSHGAISRHVRELERLYGTKLVKRLSKSSEPTPAGPAMAETLSEGFRLLNRAVARLSIGPLRGRFRLGAK